MFEWADSEEHPGGRVVSRQIVTADSASTGRSSKPDAHSSTERYAQRFSGRAGRYLLEVQIEATPDSWLRGRELVFWMSVAATLSLPGR